MRSRGSGRSQHPQLPAYSLNPDVSSRNPTAGNSGSVGASEPVGVTEVSGGQPGSEESRGDGGGVLREERSLRANPMILG